MQSPAIFMTCPAYLDNDGALRCGLPALLSDPGVLPPRSRWQVAPDQAGSRPDTHIHAGGAAEGGSADSAGAVAVATVRGRRPAAAPG